MFAYSIIGILLFMTVITIAVIRHSKNELNKLKKEVYEQLDEIISRHYLVKEKEVIKYTKAYSLLNDNSPESIKALYLYLQIESDKRKLKEPILRAGPIILIFTLLVTLTVPVLGLIDIVAERASLLLNIINFVVGVALLMLFIIFFDYFSEKNNNKQLNFINLHKRIIKSVLKEDK